MEPDLVFLREKENRLLIFVLISVFFSRSKKMFVLVVRTKDFSATLFVLTESEDGVDEHEHEHEDDDSNTISLRLHIKVDAGFIWSLL